MAWPGLIHFGPKHEPCHYRPMAATRIVFKVLEIESCQQISNYPALAVLESETRYLLLTACSKWANAFNS